MIFSALKEETLVTIVIMEHEKETVLMQKAVVMLVLLGLFSLIQRFSLVFVCIEIAQGVFAGSSLHFISRQSLAVISQFKVHNRSLEFQ